MDKPKYPVDQELNKQRRGVLVLSTIIILFDVAEIQIERINVLGTDLIVGKPELIAPFLVVVWFYFVMRYYQYRRVSGASRIAREEMREKLWHYVERYCSDQAEKGMTPSGLKPVKVGWFGGSARYALTKMGLEVPDSEVVVQLPLHRTFAWKLKSLYWVIVLTPYFFDHGLPMLLIAWAGFSIVGIF